MPFLARPGSLHRATIFLITWSQSHALSVELRPPSTTCDSDDAAHQTGSLGMGGLFGGEGGPELVVPELAPASVAAIPSESPQPALYPTGRIALFTQSLAA